jgi:predicted nucleic acid-binding protein
VGIALDTTLFIDLARRRANALAKIEELDSRRDTKVIPSPVAYEILHGILAAKSLTQAALFRGWVARFHVVPLDLAAAEKAAVIRTELGRLGLVKGVVDILAAGIAMAGSHSFVTRDSDFRAIANATGLSIESY